MTNHICSIPQKYLPYSLAAFLQSKQHFTVKNLASFFFILLFYLVLGKGMAWGQTLGGYPSGTLVAGQNNPVTSSIEDFNRDGNFTSNWGMVPFILFIIALKYIVQEGKPKLGSVSQKLSSNNENQIKQIGLASAN